MDKVPRSVADWLERKPGPFTARTENGVWRAARENFFDGTAYDGGDSLSFTMDIRRAGFDVRPTALGGYVLDAKP